MASPAIVGAALGSAMIHAVPALKAQGFCDKHFMNLVMEHLEGQGVPGAEGLCSGRYASKEANALPGFSNTNLGLQNSGGVITIT